MTLSERITDFSNIIDEIQAKYPEAFADQPDSVYQTYPAKLNNEVIMHYPPVVSIGFFEGTFVPKYIQDEVTAEFKKHIEPYL